MQSFRLVSPIFILIILLPLMKIESRVVNKFHKQKEFIRKGN